MLEHSFALLQLQPITRDFVYAVKIRDPVLLHREWMETQLTGSQEVKVGNETRRAYSRAVDILEA